MHASYSRRTATKVVDGKVRRKNRQIPTSHRGCVIDRESPGTGFRHVVTKRDLQSFLNVIPDWGELSHRLERIVLAAGDIGSDGAHQFYHREGTGVIHLNAWNADLWVWLLHGYFKAHEELLQRLGVSWEDDRNGNAVFCRFTQPQARAFLLLHVFMHELGHHWDRMHQKHRGSQRGEDYAERFANERLEELWPRYVGMFGDPRRE